MPPISIKAIAIAFAAELAADYMLSLLVFSIFAQDLWTPDMTPEAFEKVRQTVFDTTAIVPVMFVLGMTTTVLGAYLAARIAKIVPYYHGLAMGVVAMVYIVLVWRDPTWLDWLGLVLTIPASLFGAHLARKHMPLEP
jgi:hypothetical protein